MRTLPALWLLIASCAWMGCGGGGVGGPDALALDARLADARGADAAPTRVSLSGRTLDNINVSPIAGVVVGVLDHPEIATVVTDASGNYVLSGVPVNSTVILTFQIDTYMPQITRPVKVGTTNVVMYDARGFDALVKRSIVQLISGSFGETYDPTKGAIVCRIEDSQTLQGLAGATASVGGTSTGQPAVYFNASSFPDKNLTATTATGLVLLHAYTPSDDAEVSFVHATRPKCIGEGEDAPPAPLTVKVLADTLTWIPIECGP